MKAVIVEHASGSWSPGLCEEERWTLFEIAMNGLRGCVEGLPPVFDPDAYELTELLCEPMATFVTLNLHGMLRGCIGSLAPVAPLCRSIHDNAIQAACRDPRFPPVSERELPALEVHLSLLSPIVPIDDLDAFHIGEHGIILTKGMARAVYLPEVAPEQGWDKAQTLASLSQKAGLGPDAWQSGASFEVFSSVVLELRREA
jgi:AmmeMemoRadiSam system protein A